jgi:hypothetical protein
MTQKLITLTIETGIATTVAALSDLILFVVFPKTAMHLLPYVSYLLLLNTSSSWRLRCYRCFLIAQLWEPILFYLQISDGGGLLIQVLEHPTSNTERTCIYRPDQCPTFHILEGHYSPIVWKSAEPAHLWNTKTKLRCHELADEV